MDRINGRLLGLAAGLAALVGMGARAYAQRALGLDVSAWQGDLSQTTWNNFRTLDSRQFVFIRSSRGGTTGYYNQSNADNDPPTNTLSQRYDDPYFVQNITRATAAGILAGPYHFGRMDIIASTLNANGVANNGTDEANHFLQMAGPWMRPGYLVPVFDYEAGIAERTPNELATFAIDFSNRIFAVTGVRPAVYIGGNYANDLESASQSNQTAVVGAYPTLWSARWPNQSNPGAIPIQTGHPKDSYTPIYGPWDDTGVTHPWHFWQYTSMGALQSYGGNLDLDVAQGGIEYVKDHLVPALWMNDSSGPWTTLANWNSGQTPVAPVQGPGQVARAGPMTLPAVRLPGAGSSGANDTVILDRPTAAITVTMSSGSHNIRKLYARETLVIDGGSLTINYVPTADSTPISAQFSSAVTLTGTGSMSVHTLQVDATRTFTLGGGTLAFNRINLMPHSSTPAVLAVTGDINLNPLSNAAAVIANGTGTGSAGRVDLGGAERVLNVGNGSAANDVTISVPIVNGSLAKSGPGTLLLSGANTYSGSTTVDAGTLSFSSATLANSADVFVATGATLNLAFAGGPDVIDSLFFDGVSQAAGTWGAVGSSAQFTSPLITGTGLLQVMTYAAPPLPADFNLDGVVDSADLTAWASGFGTSGNATRAQGDADGDLTVDGADLLAWQRQVGGGPQGAAAVPEPAAAVLSALSMVGAALARRRCRLLLLADRRSV